LFEVPSNLALHRVGGRRWIARIMLSWSLLAGAMAFIQGPIGFYSLRFLLGVAEAGFFPGVIYYLTHWVPASERARLVGLFMTAIPISTALGGPISSAILQLDGVLGLAGWRWLFLIETVPSLLLGWATLHVLDDTPAEARWLNAAEREWLTATLRAESAVHPAGGIHSLRATLMNGSVLALSACYFGVEFALCGVILWVPQILFRAGAAWGGTGWMVAIAYTIAAIGMVPWCRHSDRTRERVWHIAIASVIAFTGLALSALLPESPLLSVLAVTAGATGTLAILPIFWTMPAARPSGVAAAGAIALINAIGNIGGFAGPFVIGWIKDATGSFRGGLVFVAAGALLTGAIALLIGRVRA
jgi:ACS family tartrate transporter-like MFS transporter